MRQVKRDCADGVVQWLRWRGDLQYLEVHIVADKCSVCGSSKLMRDIPLPDRYGKLGLYFMPVNVWIDGNPEAWIRKDRAIAKLLLTICGNCGHVEVRADNHQELYAKYLRSTGREQEADDF